jgi:hypothetical protein
MARPRKAPDTRRVKVGTRLDPDLHAWLMARTGPGKQFKDLAHGLDYAIAQLKSAEERRK